MKRHKRKKLYGFQFSENQARIERRKMRKKSFKRHKVRSVESQKGNKMKNREQHSMKRVNL